MIKRILRIFYISTILCTPAYAGLERNENSEIIEKYAYELIDSLTTIHRLQDLKTCAQEHQKWLQDVNDAERERLKAGKRRDLNDELRRNVPVIFRNGVNPEA